MDRAHNFIRETREKALSLMSKSIHDLHPREIDLIVALCGAHNEACEFVELVEKFDGKAAPHDYMKPTH